jgi:hypothetical protein
LYRKSDRVSVIEEASMSANKSPGADTYDPVHTDKFKKRTLSVALVFDKAKTNRIEKEESDAINDFYNTNEANRKNIGIKSPTFGFSKEKKASFAEKIAKRNVSPGPMQYNPSMRAYKALSPSPGGRKRS